MTEQSAPSAKRWVYNRYHGDAPAGSVYIGRGRGSSWGNPFPITDTADRDTVIAQHRAWLLTQPELLTRVRDELAGKTLICFCAPKPCHGDTLAWVANAPREEFEQLLAAALATS